MASDHLFESWNRFEQSRPARVATPRTAEEIVDIVRGHATWPSPVRASGHRHSTTGCFAADGGTQLLMDELTTIEVDPATHRVRVGAGATMLQIRDALRGHARELRVSPEIGNATAGSVACCGTKDSSLGWTQDCEGFAQISSSVVEVKLVNARGDRVLVDEDGATVIGTSGRIPDLSLKRIRSSYGLLGIIYEVTFSTVPLVPLETSYLWMPITGDPLQVPDIDAVFAGAHAVLGFLAPYSGGMLVERRTASPGAAITVGDRLRRSTRDWIWEWGATQGVGAADAAASLVGGHPGTAVRRGLANTLELAVALTNHRGVTESLGDSMAGQAARWLGRVTEAAAAPAIGALRSAIERLTDSQIDRVEPAAAAFLGTFDRIPGPLFKLLMGFTGYRSDSMIDFSRDRATFFDFTFWAFPQRRWSELVPEYIRFCQAQAAARDGFRPALFTEVYFICRDDHSMLTVAPTEPIFTLDMVHNHPGDANWLAMSRAYNEWAAAHEGRPLLNQTKQIDATPQVLPQAFGDVWTEFSSLVWEENAALPGGPDGRFVNAFFKRLLLPRAPSA